SPQADHWASLSLVASSLRKQAEESHKGHVSLHEGLSMKLIVTNDYDEMSEQAAHIVAGLIRQNPGAAIGLTTGNTPVGLYRKLVARYQANELALHEVRVFCTEEYLGISPFDPYALFAWLHREFILPCQLPSEHVFRLRGEHTEPQLACMEFDTQIQACGGLDLVVESIGLNGHIGF